MLFLITVLHGESYKGLAPSRNATKQRTPTTNRNDRQSTQLTKQACTGHDRKRSTRVKSHNNNQLRNPARQKHSNPLPAPHRHSRVNANVLSANSTQCAPQAGRTALLHRHHPHQRGHAAPPCRAARHLVELVDRHGRTASLRGGDRGGRGGGKGKMNKSGAEQADLHAYQ